MRTATVAFLALSLALPLHAAKRRAVQHPSPATVSANADAYSVVRGGTLTRAANAGVLANDTEAQAKPLTAILATTTTHGTLTLNADGGFTYVNDGSAANSDAFTYRASNGTTQSTPATVTIAITDPAPVAVNDAFNTTPGATLTVPAPGVLANDTRNQASIASYGVNGSEQTTLGNTTPTAQSGSVRVSADGAVTYIPGAGFTGADAFKYVLTNAAGSSTAQVTLNVVPVPPTATDDAFAATRNTQLTQPAPGVLANDTLNGASIVSYGKTTGGEQTTLGTNTATEKNGTIRINADGSFVFNPASGFTGTDTFKYIIANAGGNATATARITVQGSAGPDFVVESPGFFFTFTGVPGQTPVLTLQRGRTYVFEVNTDPIHPFRILNAPPGSVDNNSIFSGTLTFRVPAAAAQYQYDCPIHGFGNTINTTP